VEGIKLVRVDFRLIHGQVITKWSNTISVTRIIVVNDELASDEFMADVYRMAAPPMIDVDVIAIDQFVADAAAGAYATGNVMVLFRGIDDALAVIQRREDHRRQGHRHRHGRCRQAHRDPGRGSPRDLPGHARRTEARPPERNQKSEVNTP
jgi:hypothetical protein